MVLISEQVQLETIAEWKQFGRPSGLTIVNGDTLVVSDWESGGPVGYSDTPGGPSAQSEGTGQLWNAIFMQGRPKTYHLRYEHEHRPRRQRARRLDRDKL